VSCHGVTYDGSRSFPTGSFAYSEGVSVEERAAQWGLRKVDPKVGLPDLYYTKDLTSAEMLRRNLYDEDTNGYKIEPSDSPPPPEAFVCTDFLLCTIPITIGVRLRPPPE